MSQLVTTIENLSAADIITIGNELIRKNLRLTEVKVEVYTTHIIIRDHRDTVLSWTKRKLQRIPA
jgi:hypothetical protein